MKRYRGVNLGRRLVRVWRWVVRRRTGCYLCVVPAACSISKSNLSVPSSTTMTRKLFHWGRHIARRLGRRGGGGGRASPDDRKFGAEAPLLEGEGGREAPPPRGHLAVYVGGEKGGGPLRRYTVPVIYCNHPLFGELLREAEEEFGFHHAGGITIPCPAAEFERIRTRIAAAAEKFRRRTTTFVWS